MNFSLNGLDFGLPIRLSAIHMTCHYYTVCGLVTLSKLSAAESRSSMCSFRVPPRSDNRRM